MRGRRKNRARRERKSKREQIIEDERSKNMKKDQWRRKQETATGSKKDAERKGDRGGPFVV